MQAILNHDINQNLNDLKRQKLVNKKLDKNNKKTEPFKLNSVKNRDNESFKNNHIFVKNILIDNKQQEKMEQIRKEQEKMEQIRMEQERMEQERMERIRMEQIRMEQIRMEQIRMEQIRMEQIRMEQIRMEQIRKEQEMMRQVNNYLTNKTINLIYQYKYKNNITVTGLGDFIRGVYFILQFCERNNLNYEINISKHKIKKYLAYFSYKEDISKSIESSIPFLDNMNGVYTKKSSIIDYNYLDKDQQFLNQINHLPDYNNNIFLYTINHPDKNKISENHKQIIQNILKPSEHLNNLIEEDINDLNLIKKNFITIHIRTNDICLSNNSIIHINQIKNLANIINKIYVKHNLDIFILSSDYKIKNLILKLFPYVKFLKNKICHTCNIDADDIDIINTLKEFYIMSYSKYIYSFSEYDHGSGFSRWCAVTYHIPYICCYLQK